MVLREKEDEEEEEAEDAEEEEEDRGEEGRSRVRGESYKLGGGRHVQTG